MNEQNRLHDLSCQVSNLALKMETWEHQRIADAKIKDDDTQILKKIHVILAGDGDEKVGIREEVRILKAANKKADDEKEKDAAGRRKWRLTIAGLALPFYLEKLLNFLHGSPSAAELAKKAGETLTK